MGSNSTQAVAVTLFLVGFVLIAGGMAGGGIILWVGGVALVAVSAAFFMKSKAAEQHD